MMGWTEEDKARMEALGDHRRAPALPRSGRSQDRIYLQRNQDYPADTDLCFERGNAVTLVRMTGRDMHAARAVLTEQGDLDAMKARARDLIDFGAVADAERDGPEELAAAVENLAVTAHAAGYRLAVDDMRHAASEKGYVSDFLGELLAAYPLDARGPGRPGFFIQRVIEILGWD